MPRRTTLTLDDDIARKLDQAARDSGLPFRDVVNETLRRGLNPADQPKATRFRVRPHDLKLRPGLSVDNIEELLEQAEGSGRR